MCASYHAEDMERTFLWGKKTITTLNGKQFRLTDGVVQQIEAGGGHVVSAASDDSGAVVAGDFSRGDLEDFIRVVFRYNVMGQPNERIPLGGENVVARLRRSEERRVRNEGVSRC